MANSYTPGLSLRKPARGDDYWDDDLNANADILEAALGIGVGVTGVIASGLEVSEDSYLTVAYASGSCRVDGTKHTIAAGTKACADNALNFLYVDGAGAVQAATALPSPPYCALALVETSGGEIVRIADLRRRIVDPLNEHDENGSHGVIKPTRVEPTGTAGAYRRSSSNWRDPESQVNNVILKPDPYIWLSLPNRSTGSTDSLTASNQGSKYVPADANGVIVLVACIDSTDQSSFALYPTGESAVAASHKIACHTRWTYAQMMVRLNSAGKFSYECYNAPAGQAWIRIWGVGWIEPA